MTREEVLRSKRDNAPRVGITDAAHALTAAVRLSSKQLGMLALVHADAAPTNFDR